MSTMAKKKRAADKNAPPPPEAPATAEAQPQTAPAPAETPKPGWRTGLDFVVMLAGAVLAALLIKAYAFDVYLIPSGSMETALHGRPDGGDRIFCSKLNYRFREPKRWEVAVFEFPYETARRTDTYGISEQYRGQNFVKRIVGLPGESLAIGRGDIWVRRGSGRAEYQRLVKPDKVQRGIWLNVYEQNFSDISLRELQTFWELSGGHAALERGAPLRLSAVSGPARMEYRPMIPAGSDRTHMIELPGVPDRYTVEQPVQFECRAELPDGTICGHVYVQTFRTQNMQARCPSCGSLQNELSAIFYHRRSGLAGIGRYAVDAKSAPQGEDVPPRHSDYHIVPDLRVVADVVFESVDTAVSVVLREDARSVRAVVHGNGQAEIRLNNEPSRVERRAVASIRPGQRHRLEFYVVDGTARLFIDSTENAAIDSAVWNDKRPLPRNVPKSSGAALELLSGDATIASLTIDRDIFYYSGLEQERGEQFESMRHQGEVFIDENSFFPMGDHCPSSFDARSWGPVPLSMLRGPAMLVWWPPERFGLIASPP